MTTVDLTQLALDNWQVVFLYGFKYLKNMEKLITQIDKIVAVHEIEIKNLKKG